MRKDEISQKIRQAADINQVLYVYRCAACHHRAQLHLSDDSHDGEPAFCAACGAPVWIEWDGGVTFQA